MPKRRSPLAETSPNKFPASTTHDTKKAKTEISSSTTRSGAEFKPQRSQSSDANPLPHKPTYVNVQWPTVSDSDPDMPQPGELIDSWCDRVSDLGFPISEEASHLQDRLSEEIEKRNQDLKDLFIHTSWNGWGIAEVMENFLGMFDDAMKDKEQGPESKWAFVEAIACHLEGKVDAWSFMDNDSSDDIKAILDMFGVMTLTALNVLDKHGLFKPDSEIKNIPIVCLILLEFLKGPAEDLEPGWGCEIVRLCDERGVLLKKSIRKQVAITGDDLRVLRQRYGEKMKRKAELYRKGNAYDFYEEKEDWIPDDDVVDGKRRWYRWDWGLEYPLFRKGHSGGTQHDLTKWSKAKLRKYSLFQKMD